MGMRWAQLYTLVVRHEMHWQRCIRPSLELMQAATRALQPSYLYFRIFRAIPLTHDGAATSVCKHM